MTYGKRPVRARTRRTIQRIDLEARQHPDGLSGLFRDAFLRYAPFVPASSGEYAAPLREQEAQYYWRIAQAISNYAFGKKALCYSNHVECNFIPRPVLELIDELREQEARKGELPIPQGAPTRSTRALFSAPAWANASMGDCLLRQQK